MNCVGGGGRYNVVLRNSVGIGELQCLEEFILELYKGILVLEEFLVLLLVCNVMLCVHVYNL